MNKQNSHVIWQLAGTTAQLQTPQLRATVDLLSPHAGLGQLVVHGQAIDGYVLGIAPDTTSSVSPSSSPPPLSPAELSEAFVRGGDLVATYAPTKDRPSSLQIYWRATLNEKGVLLLDAILSLETDRLESFPDLTAFTQLPAASAWALTEEEIRVEPEQADALNSAPLFLQSPQLDWSYAESPHPDDRGECQLTRPTEGEQNEKQNETYKIVRQLGGRFLEKGVIRRLRIRGVFLPKANDFKLAAQCLASLETEAPPLTT